ncbi:MAG: S8 family peptidase [Candidatus Woesearchaeota archaeon]|jgi:subtilisin family serine protease|nr:S8 family peptidase [Candidatus Woesearchaeota archaeon]MDP7182070.1 S8 family peptidase [Candidatus Woesearchaeota archaeon]MDP7198672.1 S8 family peptidase [Candidatus Woesearchaeota archaeon]MDP7467646.1 S8 family peptidase [Candidatus Woesearchaeota archaeon]MDP7647136.1 S8 family peptidase [Candidatus Woesearchaeota archaeon]
MLEALEKALSGFKDEYEGIVHSLKAFNLDHWQGQNYIIMDYWLADIVKGLTPLKGHKLKSSKAYAFKMHALDAKLLSTCLARFPVAAAMAKSIFIPYTFHNKTSEPILPNLKQIGVPQAHQQTRGEGTLVAILDTGITTHRELATYEGGKSFVGGKETDRIGHGTHVAGTVCGQRTGVAPGARFIAGKVLNDEGTGSEVDIIRGIEWAVKQGANIISMSLGSTRDSPFERRAIEYAINKGVQVVAAAGNDGKEVYTYPASYEGVWSSAAVDVHNHHASFSNRNDRVQLSAPGVNIVSAYLKNGYAYMSGTSMATPHVAGVLALAHSLQRPYRSIADTALPLGDVKEYGHGLVQAQEVARALRVA